MEIKNRITWNRVEKERGEGEEGEKKKDLKKGLTFKGKVSILINARLRAEATNTPRT
jgi:hypothetical protein